MNPIVSVAMTAHNCERYIREAVEGMLTQTFDDFELIVVNDASTDGTGDILDMIDDERLKVVNRAKNTCSGNVARNDALAIARGRYIAIADGDDVSVMDRLALQVAFLDANPSVGIVGGGLVPTTHSGDVLGGPVFKPQLSSRQDYRERMLRGECVLLNGAMMLRRELLETNELGGYGPYVSSGDTEFLIRASRTVNFANLRKVLIFCRQHADQVTRRFGARLRSLHHRLFTLQELVWSYEQCGYPVREIERERGRVLTALNKELHPMGIRYA